MPTSHAAIGIEVTATPILFKNVVNLNMKSLEKISQKMSAIGLPAHILALFTTSSPLHQSPNAEGHDGDSKSSFTGISEYLYLFTSKPEGFQNPCEPKVHQSTSFRHRNDWDFKNEFSERNLTGYTSDPIKTIFVGRLSYDTTERTLKAYFEDFGSVRGVKIIYDQAGKSRGYCFVEFDSETAAMNALRLSNRARIDGRIILVDIERSRTEKGWLPRRLGGGRGPGRTSIFKK